MKELTIKLSADVVFTLGRDAERAGFTTLADYVAHLLKAKSHAHAQTA